MFQKFIEDIFYVHVHAHRVTSSLYLPRISAACVIVSIYFFSDISCLPLSVSTYRPVLRDSSNLIKSNFSNGKLRLNLSAVLIV